VRYVLLQHPGIASIAMVDREGAQGDLKGKLTPANLGTAAFTRFVRVSIDTKP
jgi:hypothetical protein